MRIKKESSPSVSTLTIKFIKTQINHLSTLRLVFPRTLSNDSFNLPPLIEEIISILWYH